MKAKYRQVKNKSTNRIKLLGFLKEVMDYEASVFFEKKGDTYVLKQFSYSINNISGLERKIAFQKKKERFLLDKKLEEIEVNLRFKLSQKTSFDYFVLDNKEVDMKELERFKEEERVSFEKTKEGIFIKNLLLPITTINEIEMYKH